MQNKIKVMRYVKEDGFQYSVEDWEAYLKLRRSRSLPEPAARFHYHIGFDTKVNFEALHGEFDRQVPLFYELAPDMCEIVDGGPAPKR
ncbi:MAG: hypothetical protein H0T76_13995 [Nannocystis sp.]|nr:hypothetical protein [Nannocystis sp.]MBA3547592.1 hypothetical protein [Nannocystis sp.]